MMDWAVAPDAFDAVKTLGFQGMRMRERPGKITKKDDGYDVTGGPIESVALFDKQVPARRIAARRLDEVVAEVPWSSDLERWDNLVEAEKDIMAPAPLDSETVEEIYRLGPSSETRKGVNASLTKTALNVPKLVKDFGAKLVQRYISTTRIPNRTVPEPLTPETVINTIAQQDPTPNKEYTAWITGNFTRGDIPRFEDIGSRVIPALKRFHALKSSRRIPNEERDIGRIKGLKALEDLVAKYEQVETTSKREQEAEKEQQFFKNGEAELVFDDAKYKIVIPKTAETSCYFGINTRWCTAAGKNNMFQTYNSEGPLYIVLVKEDNQRYQFHLESGQFMDERDDQIEPFGFFDEHPELAKIFLPIADEVMASGDAKCESCDGAGNEECSNCGGLGYVDCGSCDGAGEVECSECAGTGDNPADTETTCSNCEGAGTVLCPDCEESSGHETCPNCDGKKSWDCDECNGSGFNQQMDYFRDAVTDAVWSRRRTPEVSQGVKASWAKKAAGFAFKSFKKLWHIGTLNIADKGQGSLEGAGLSVSVNPREWQNIARIGGDLWEFTKPGNKFVNFHRITKPQREQIVQWGVANGYVEPTKIWRATWYDDEMEEEIFSDFTKENEAKQQAEGMGGTVTTVDNGIVMSRKLGDRSRHPRWNDPMMAWDMLVTVYAEDELDCDGVWWQDTFDPSNLSAPRGVIFPSKVASWAKKKVKSVRAAKIAYEVMDWTDKRREEYVNEWLKGWEKGEPGIDRATNTAWLYRDEAGKPIAFAAFDESHITDMGVKKMWRNKGIITKLLDALEQEKGIREIKPPYTFSGEQLALKRKAITSAAAKPTPTQLAALGRMVGADGTIHRERGGFWVSGDAIAGWDKSGLPRFKGEEEGQILDPRPWVDVRTVRAMEKRGWVERTNQFPQEWADTRRVTDAGRAAAAITKQAMKINVPDEAKDHFWEEPPAGSEEFWAFVWPVRAKVGDQIFFQMDKKPVAEAVISRIEPPGQSECERTGQYKNRWKVYWTPESFKKL